MKDDEEFSLLDKEKLLLRELAKKGAATANEVIDTIFKSDLRKGNEFVIKRGWRFYVHLNKHFSTLERQRFIDYKADKVGPTGRVEKVWTPTSKTLAKYFPKPDRKKGVKLRIKLSLKKIRTKANK